MSRIVLAMTLAAVAGGLTQTASAGHPGEAIRRAHMDRGAAWYNANQSWHGGYNHVLYGRPLALIVPPTANFQTNYSWGVGRTTMTPIYHQFGRPVAVPTGPAGLSAAPVWPSNTNQIGVYYSRGPW